MNDPAMGTCRCCGARIAIDPRYLPLRVLVDHAKPPPTRRWCGGSQTHPTPDASAEDQET